MEIWKNIEGFGNKYEVSNLGRVKKKETTKRHYFGGFSIVKEKILIPNKHREGYLYAQLIVDGKKTPIGIHRLVAEAFIENPNNLPFVNHKDENKENNNVENLEWCTREYNNNYGTRLKRISESNKGRKRTEEQIYIDYEKKFQDNLETLKQYDKSELFTITGRQFYRNKINRTAGLKKVPRYIEV